MRFFLLFCIYIYAVHLSGQSNLNFGSWESHLAYQRGISVTQSDSKVYYATESAIMSVDKEDLSLDFISKVDGLSTLGITKLKYDPFSGNMVVIYQDSDIDIITEEGIFNIADIKKNTGIFGDKRINDVHFDSGMKAYFSTGFGVVSFDMNTFEFGFTTQMGLRVNAVTSDEDNKLYAATEDGIYVLDLNANYNFGDFGNWDFISSEAGLPLAYNAVDIAYFGSTLFTIIGRRVYQLKEGVFDPIYIGASGEEVLFLNASGKELIIGVRTPAQFSSRLIFIDDEFRTSEGTRDCANFILDAVMEESGRIWYADEWNNFRYTDGKDENCQRFTAPSPYSHNVSELRVQDKVLYAASGGVTEGFNFLSNRDGIYILEDGQWSNYNESNNGAMQQAGMVNSFVITPDPLGENVYVGSFFNGLLKVNFKTGAYEHFYSDNSPITGPQGSPTIEKVSGLVFDDQNNLWISVYEADKPLVALTPEGTFHSFSIPASTRIGQIIVDEFGYLWIQVTGASGGILVFDYNRTVKDPSDDRFRFINTSNSRLKSNSVNCLEMDQGGDVWVGTASGPIIFECGDPFDVENCVGSIRTVLEDSIPAELLITEDVRSIAIDGANRKWIGSRNGIFVQSPNGTEKVDRFTIENSPLFDNNIIDMAFDGSEGIMYIASNGGIQAYKTETTEGGRLHQRNAYAFPNPVRPDYEGLIAIRGLARDATIKITDIKGQLIYETEALGGQALWDGRDYSGRKVSSGVYLVFSNSRDIFEDPNTAVTKILVVR